jgi:hypothetical protein
LNLQQGLLNFSYSDMLEILTEFYRRSTLALMQLVHDAKCPDDGIDFPNIKASNYLRKETMNERAAALLIVQRVMDEEKLTWTRINEELTNRSDKDWYGPGNVIDLAYLAIYIKDD